MNNQNYISRAPNGHQAYEETRDETYAANNLFNQVRQPQMHQRQGQYAGQYQREQFYYTNAPIAPIQSHGQSLSVDRSRRQFVLNKLQVTKLMKIAISMEILTYNYEMKDDSEFAAMHVSGHISEQAISRCRQTQENQKKENSKLAYEKELQYHEKAISHWREEMQLRPNQNGQEALNRIYDQEIREYIRSKEEAIKETRNQKIHQLETLIGNYFRLTADPIKLIDDYLNMYLNKRIFEYNEKFKNETNFDQKNRLQDVINDRQQIKKELEITKRIMQMSPNERQSHTYLSYRVKKLEMNFKFAEQNVIPKVREQIQILGKRQREDQMTNASSVTKRQQMDKKIFTTESFIEEINNLRVAQPKDKDFKLYNLEQISRAQLIQIECERQMQDRMGILYSNVLNQVRIGRDQLSFKSAVFNLNYNQMLGFEQTPVEDDIEDIANEVAVPLNQQHLMVNTQYENEGNRVQSIEYNTKRVQEVEIVESYEEKIYRLIQKCKECGLEVEISQKKPSLLVNGRLEHVRIKNKSRISELRFIVNYLEQRCVDPQTNNTIDVFELVENFLR